MRASVREPPRPAFAPAGPPERLPRADSALRRGTPSERPERWLARSAGLPEEPRGARGLAAVGQGIGAAANELVRARGPLRRVLAALAGRFVAQRGWERLGFARPGDWARERVGLAARTLHDLARVDAQLARLPAVEAALVSGALPWTKVRLVARAATPEDEAAWVEWARGQPSSRLAREVRAVDLGSLEACLGPAAAAPSGSGSAEWEPPCDEDGLPDEERACLEVRCTPVVRAKWWYARQLARRAAGEALPAGAAMEAVAAEVLSAVPLEVFPEEPSPPSLGAAETCAAQGSTAQGSSWRGAAGSPAPGPPPCARGAPRASPEAPALPAPLRALVRGLAAADAFELDARLRRAVALEQRLESELGDHLLQVAERRLHLAGGLRSLEEYARERLGISPRRARGILRLARAQRRWPELHAAWRSGALSSAKAQVLIPMLAAARPGEAARWVEHATRVTLRRLEEDAERAALGLEPRLAVSDPNPAGRQERAQPRAPEIDEAAAVEGRDAGEEDCRVLWWGPADSIRLFRATLCTLRRRLERLCGRKPSEGDALEAMLDHAILAWGGRKERVRREWRVLARDGFRCSVPGCSSYRNLHVHHVVFLSAGGSDAASNRTTLCAWHHLRGVHAGRVRITGRAPRRLRFELGLRAGHAPLLAHSADEVLLAAN